MVVMILPPRSSSDFCPRLTPKAEPRLLTIIPILLPQCQHMALSLLGNEYFFPPQGINSHPFGRVQHFSFHFSLSSACPGHCCEHLSGDFGVCYPKNGQKWILRSHIIISLLQLLVLSVWTEHSGKFKLCFTLELSRFSCNLLLFWLCKGEIPLQDTDPTPGISSTAQTSRGVRMTAANPPVIKIFQPSVPSL